LEPLCSSIKVMTSF